jgi:serine O-acetyltransferase
MNASFLQQLFDKQQLKEQVPSNEIIAGWALELISILYPQLSDVAHASTNSIENDLQKLEKELVRIMNATKACYDCNNEAVSRKFLDGLPEIYRLLNTDVAATHMGDPAATTEFEVVRAYPGFLAMCFFRIAHALHKLEVPLLPRILTEYAHSKTGIDIHPNASIDEYFMMDHGTGIVIGETCIIGKNVKMYQGVTLGALSVDKNQAFQKRHPTIKDNVIIYSGATILGGDTVVGEDSVIGGNVWLTQSVPAGSLVFHKPEVTVVAGKFSTKI